MSPKESPHLRLRLAPQLLAGLEKARAKNGRTLTGEIAIRLESSFRREDIEQIIEQAIRRVITLNPRKLK